MGGAVITVENLYKEYKLGVISHGTLTRDLQSWWAKVRGKEDPNSLISTRHREDADKESFLALKDISFEVKEGDRIGIIGKNGAGKSTLLKILSRITSPTKGLVKISGRVGSLLEVGTGFHPELTGRENIFLNGSILGMTKNEILRKLDEIVEFAGVGQHLDTPVKRYSSGMMVRLGFAVAAHLDPEILLVDEVLAVGDAEFQKKAIGKMQDVSEVGGRTILFVSHNMESISKLTKTCIFLQNGVLRNIGLTSIIIKEYFDSNNRIMDNIYVNNSFSEKPYIRRVELKTSFSNNIQLHGDKLEIVFELVTNEVIKSACFSFQFQDSKETNYVHQWLFDVDEPFCRQPGVYILTCTIPSLQLYMGKYTVKCYFFEPPGGIVFESLENICPFEVVMHETTRSLFQWQPYACAYMEKSYWTVNQFNQ